MFNLKLLIIVVLCCFTQAHAEQKNVLDRFLNDLNTFSAEFEQSLVDATGEVLETSKGTVYLNYPGQFHWQYTQPYAQRLITDGTDLWVYDEDLAQVTIKEIKNELDNTPAAILSGSDDFYTHFDLINKGSEEDIQLIELAPKDAENQFHSIRLGFAENKLVLMVMFDKLGQITKVKFDQAQRNTSLDENLFTFTPPEGVDVIDGRETSSE